MPYKPIISKIRCHNPNLKSTKHANRANLHYIATREGVDSSEVSDEQQDNRMYKYAPDEEYTRYMAKRPRSHGLFGNIETDDLKSVEQLVYKTSQNGTNIYRGIISLSEQDAQELGYVNSRTWYTQLNSMMPDIAKELGISPTNFTWIGAFHAEPSHPHVHYQIWDNTEKIKSSFLHVSIQKRCRAVIEKAIFPEEYERTLQAVFESEREELYSTKNASREKITNYFKDVMNMPHVPGIQHTDLPAKLPSRDAETLAKHLETLQDILPASGRTNYKFMPPEVKKELDKISDIVFKQPDTKAALSQYLEAASHIHQIKSPGYDKHALDNARKEMYRRTGNIILKNMTNYLKQLSSYEEQIEKKLIEDKLYSTQSSLPDEDFFLAEMNEGADTLFPSEDMPNQEESRIQENLAKSRTVSEASQDITSGQIKILRNEQLPETPGQYCMEWNKNYKAALSLLYDDKDSASAIKLLYTEAENGNSLAYAELGKIYYRGIGVDADMEAAEQYYKHAFLGFSQVDESASTPNAYCKYRLGKLYESGFGTQQDLEKARLYYSAAASKKKPYAEYSLGKLYLSHAQEFSENLKTDLTKIIQLAEENLKLSADHGFSYGAYEYAKLHDDNSEISIPYYTAAYNGFQKLADDREDGNLLYRLGKMTLDGKGAKKDISKAIKLLTSSAEQDNQFAQYALGKLYLGTDFPEHQDIEKAIDFLTSSAEQGNQFAQFKLGIIYLYGKYSIEKDEELGKEYLQQSAAQGNTYAQETLQNYEDMHSPMHAMASIIYRIIYAAMMSENHKKHQQLADVQWKLSKQARIEKKRQEEITHL